ETPLDHLALGRGLTVGEVIKDAVEGLLAAQRSCVGRSRVALGLEARDRLPRVVRIHACGLLVCREPLWLARVLWRKRIAGWVESPCRCGRCAAAAECDNPPQPSSLFYGVVNCVARFIDHCFRNRSNVRGRSMSSVVVISLWVRASDISSNSRLTRAS